MTIGMTAGVATAQDTDSAVGSVTISCPIPATVQLGGNFDFDPIANIYQQQSTQTDAGEIDITVDMGCYWGPWQVGAQASNFTAPGGAFSASHFSLQDATVSSYYLDGIDGPGDPLEPEASDAFFSSSSDEDVILETDENFIWIFQLPDTPAPFVTTAEYTGHLDNLPVPLLIALGVTNTMTFQTTLTVELTLD
jgi:hypothetical protein